MTTNPLPIFRFPSIYPPRQSDFWNEEDSRETLIELSPFSLPNAQESTDFPKHKDDVFEIDFNVKNFSIEDLEVEIEDNYLVIHGKHDMKVDAHGIIEREFKRRYPLPDDVDIGTLKASLYGGSILHVEIKKKNATNNEHVIPIVIQKV